MQRHPDTALKLWAVRFLKENLPANYVYHNADHTLYVAKQVLEIGKAENCSETEIRLLYAAALLHDIGYVEVYKGHEEAGCRIARMHLDKFGYDKAEINTVCKLILATKIPQHPQGKLQEIIADADLAYLGTNNAKAFAHLLFLEQQSRNPTLTLAQWNEIQIQFISQHRYFTSHCKKTNEPIKHQYLKELLIIKKPQQ